MELVHQYAIQYLPREPCGHNRQGWLTLTFSTRDCVGRTADKYVGGQNQIHEEGDNSRLYSAASGIN